MKRTALVLVLAIVLCIPGSAFAMPVDVIDSYFHVEGSARHEDYIDNEYQIVSKTYDLYSQNPISENVDFSFPSNPQAAVSAISTADFFSVSSYAIAQEDSFARAESLAESIVYFRPTYDFYGATLNFNQTGADAGYGSVTITDMADSVVLWDTDHYDALIEPHRAPWVGDDGIPFPGYPLSEIVTLNFYADHIYKLNMLVEGAGDLGYFSGGFSIAADFTPISTTPVPEPATVILLSIGLAGIVRKRNLSIYK